ncbi:hypothetical protein EVC45_02440 [Paraburkholderia sp. UYCP14C]|uniref:hypothetical protein n=1 Tax=Paraburkholderia sp. UYCP14C TaxID=2511130 RepID=UPI00101F8E93|nr:hypothetical protein [Paraburkholderia sp. UYCP14C]RZF31331.1 hypothetical protein EVC45_02440 [Paraburkholderia sp. UYCP14C]
MDTMKQRGDYNGPTNGTKVVHHTDGNRMLEAFAAEQNAALQAQAYAARVAEACAAKASAPEPDVAAETSTESTA